ncbi:hypothetical protein QQS21_005217 [Conoideocrella luteorostrata]|uniref:FAD/NAD(P)-binding domain-containing protein n=1 Tax=Conoideocrella luteorostrata TaxID=1105319 RepID=A0AAJ0CU46_9HYPO|nr:hypothetical protein QQS21_005217 [Conoideocrella luteorostrata]
MEINVDVLVIGAGFAGCLSLHHLRRQGLSVKIMEAGSDLGGVWHSNKYPGARVDSMTPYYQVTSPDIFNDWSFNELYPTAPDLKKYFDYLDEKWNLRKDIFFNQKVIRVEYCHARWRLLTDMGLRPTARFVIFVTGTTNKAYIPDFPKIQSFNGQVIHPAAWPEKLSLEGKKVGIIGQGASGIQIFEQLAKRGHDITVFIRTPPVALPMKNRPISETENQKNKFGECFKRAKYGDEAGFPWIPYPKRFRSESSTQQQELFQRLWKRGGLGIVSNNYMDLNVDKEANRALYDFWSTRVRERVKDPRKKDILAPLKPVQPIGTKRPCLEQNYYELIDQENVTLVDLKKTPVEEFTSNGILTAGDTLHQLDVVIAATGYDSVTGSLYDIDIFDKHEVTLKENWRGGIRTYLGMMVPGMPNAFILYGPQAPTSLTSGPPFIELQVEWIVKLLRKMEKDSINSVDSTWEAAEAYNKKLRHVFNRLFHSKAPSWWVGANIPTKRREPLLWFDSTGAWSRECAEALNNWSQFNTIREGKRTTKWKI